MAGHAAEPVFDSSWVPAQPETLTYRSTSPQGDGMYQLSVWRENGEVQLYMNIITTGFTKSVWGAMTQDMRPRQSTSRIVVGGRVTMTTECDYQTGGLRISTRMMPYNTTAQESIAATNRVIDYSQAPLVGRFLPLKAGAEFRFDSLNPQSNRLTPLHLKVTGEEAQHGVDCFKVEAEDFEGQSTYWVEKTGHHRVMRVEQPATKRVTELIL